MLASRTPHPWRLALCALALVCLPALAQETAPGVSWIGETTAPRFDVVLAGVAKGALPSAIFVNAEDEANCLVLRFEGGKARLERVIAGKTSPLGEATLPTGYERGDVVLSWRNDRISLVAGNHELIRAWEHTRTSGKAGCIGDIGDAELLIQTVEPMLFTDDFGRLQGSMGDWRVQSGSWWNEQNIDIVNDTYAQDGANPFAFGGKSEAGKTALSFSVVGAPADRRPLVPSVALNGQEFQSDYWLESAVRSEGADAIGLVAYAGPEPEGEVARSMLAARWTSQMDAGPSGDRLQILALDGEQATVLAESAGGFKPEQWYRMRLEVSVRAIAVLIDGRKVLETPNKSGYIRGRLGVWCEGDEAALFDDIRAGSLAPGKYRFPEDSSAWRCTEGLSSGKDGWTLGRGAQSCLALLAEQLANVEVSVDLAKAGNAGELLLGYRADNECWSVAWGGGVRLIRRRPEGESVVASTSAAIEAGRRGVLTARVEDECFHITLDGSPILEAADGLRLPGAALGGSPDDPESDPRRGAVGLKLGPGARVTAVDIREVAISQAARLTDQFVRETGTMSEWATVAGAWIDPTKVPYSNGVAWNKGDFAGDVKVRVSLVGDTGAASVFLGATDWDRATGYELKVATRPEGGLALDLLRAGASLAQGTFAGKPPQTVEWKRRGNLLTVAIGSEMPISVVDPAPPTGTKAGLLPEGLTIDYSTSYALASDQMDYTFSEQPDAWSVLTGTWELSSRWTCSPQWSWWSGKSQETALMWSKPSFEGDQTVEMYASLKMGLAPRNTGLSYEHPHDMNLALCGDGVSVGSGYSFIVGGSAQDRTQIWRGSVLLAETRDAKAMLPRLSNGLPDMNEFHRKWWQVRAEKRGPRLRLFLDDQLVLEAVDPMPLTGGHVGVWTWENGIMVSRIRIYGREGTSVLAPRVTPDKVVAGLQGDGTALPTVSSEAWPSLVEDFETGRGEFRTYYRTNQSGPAAEHGGGIEQGATLVLDATNPGGGKQSLKLVNENPGGNFGAYALQHDFSPATYGTLTFDYRIGPEVRADIVVRTTVRPFAIGFTGPPAPPFGHASLGRIEGVQSDGKWHRARFDLRGALRDQGIDPASLTVTDVVVGYFGEDRLLSTGTSGNPRGAAWWIDNFGVCEPGPASGTLAWQEPTTPLMRGSAPGAAQFRAVVSTRADEEPPTSLAPSAEKSLAVSDLGPGVQYLHVESLDAQGARLGLLHHRFEVARDAPTVARCEPAEKSAIGGGKVLLHLDGVDSGLKAETLALRVNGVDLTPAAPGIAVSCVERTITVDLDALLDPTLDRVELPIELVAGSTSSGAAIAPRVVSYRLNRTLDRTPPTAPEIAKDAAALVSDDFETNTGSWLPWAGGQEGDGAQLVLDGSTAAEGATCLALVKPGEAGRFGVTAIAEQFDAGKHRFLSFDYKVPSWVRIDMLLRTADGVTRVLKMTDSDSEGGEIVVGSLPIVADDQWHHCDLDLLSVLQGALPKAGDYRVDRVSFAGGGWDGNPKGTTWRIDDFRLDSVVSSRDGLAVAWSSRDATGIAGSSYLIDSDPNAEPDTVADAPDQQLIVDSSSPAGLQWLHVRTVDGRGNWSATTSERILIDPKPLQVSNCTIPNGQSACLDTFALVLADEGGGQMSGVDPRSIELRVNEDPPYSVDGRTLVYDASTNRLTWNGQAVRGKPRTFLDGEQVRVALEKASDYAGNPIDTTFATSFTMDFALDAEPPKRPRIQSDTHPTAVFEPFESSVGTARAGDGTSAELDREAVKTPAAGTIGGDLGTGCLRVTHDAGASFGATLVSGSADLAKTPYLAFSYCCPPGATLTLVLNVNGREIPVLFTEPDVQAGRKIANATADGIWRGASLQLLDVAQDVLGRQGTYILRELSVRDMGEVHTPVGASVWFDNLWLTGGGKGPARFAWDTQDPTGITGYSWAFDNSPFTVPAETVSGDDAALRMPPPASGAHYLHVRARDGAGHWSEAAHMGIYQQE